MAQKSFTVKPAQQKLLNEASENLSMAQAAFQAMFAMAAAAEGLDATAQLRSIVDNIVTVEIPDIEPPKESP